MTHEQLAEIVTGAVAEALKGLKLAAAPEQKVEAPRRPKPRRRGGDRPTYEERVFDYIVENGRCTLAEIGEALKDYGCSRSAQTTCSALHMQGLIARTGRGEYGPR